MVNGEWSVVNPQRGNENKFLLPSNNYIFQH